MDEDELLKELQELSKNMEQELSQQKEAQSAEKPKETQPNLTIPNLQQSNPLDFNMFGNEADYLKEIEKMLSLNLGGDSNIDDAKTEEAMKLLDENLKGLAEKLKSLEQQTDNTKQAQEFTTTATSNPFVDSYKEMSSNQEDEMKELFGLLNMQGTEGGDISDLYNILGKLSNNADQEAPVENKEKQLQHLFQDLLELLLKSDMLAEPLNQIKGLVKKQLENDKLKPEEKEKFELTLVYIDTIFGEINKPQPDKTVILEMFNKLHELSDFDNEMFSEISPGLKDISGLFGGKFK